jgi:hypothetical protein
MSKRSREESQGNYRNTRSKFKPEGNPQKNFQKKGSNFEHRGKNVKIVPNDNAADKQLELAFARMKIRAEYQEMEDGLKTDNDKLIGLGCVNKFGNDGWILDPLTGMKVALATKSQECLPYQILLDSQDRPHCFNMTTLGYHIKKIVGQPDNFPITITTSNNETFEIDNQTYNSIMGCI